MNRILLLIVMVIISSGCSSKLKVIVRTADREQVIKYGGDLIRADIVNSTVAIEAFLNNSASDKKLILDKIKAKIISEHKGGKIEANTEKQWGEDFDYAVAIIRNHNKKAIDALLKITPAADTKTINDAYVEAYKYIDDTRLLTSTFIYNITTAAGIKNPNTAELISGTVLETTKNELNSSRMRFPIIGDPLTSFITKTENKNIWKSTFNKTRSFTLFGNSDIAVILRSNPPEKELKSGDYNNNFTIKGVRMDAADATNAIFTSLAQTMNFISSLQGIPLPQSQKPTQENPAPETTQLMQDIETNTKSFNLETKKLETAKKLLLQKMLIENTQSKSGADLTASIKRIEDFWNELKKTLE
ncbi:hypothetical protein [Flavobacterium psychrotrophum]|uniref:hypothetical protein n=1 Tax=Flavobacterium psychrotrophum TaxID=2294119 RepID=UPI0013C4A874|nr:hypothetical protein [Flavobacterium psychrotrophum]